MGRLSVIAAVALAALALPSRVLASPSVAQLSARERTEYQAAGTWSSLFDPSSLANRYPLVFWVAALLVLAAVGFPYVWLAAGSLPDRGYSFARPVGLLLVGWVVWLAASLEAVTFSRTTIVVTILLVGSGAAAIVATHRRAFLRSLRARWRLLAVEETAFWALFGAALWVRWLNPDLWHPTLGGEKPMDLAYLNAVVKSVHFPPYDPWFAGGYINYYYFGFVLVAVLVKLTAIVPSVAYNLAVATFAALLGGAAFGAAVALGGRARRRGLRASYAVTGCLGLLFVSVAGNLGELRVIRERLDGPVPIEWWYWNASRAIGHSPLEPGPINEFPAFTFLFADLHAHAMALPFTATVLGLSLSFLWPPPRRRAARVGRFGVLAVALGALWPLNTWDVPTYALVVLLLLVLGALRAPRARLLRALAGAGAYWVGLVCAAYLAFLPFHLDYVSSFDGVERWRGSRTALGDYLTIHGLFLFTIAAAVTLDLLFGRDVGSVGRTVRLALRNVRRLPRAYRAHRALVRPRPAYRAAVVAVAAGALLAFVLAAAGQGVPALVVALLTLLGADAERRHGSRDRFWQATLGLACIALALTLAVELFVVAKIDVGRVNTVFKTYLQVWTLLGVCSAVAVARLGAGAARLRRPLALGVRAAFVALLAVALLYPVLAVRAKVRDRFDTSVGRTLDGSAFMTRAVFIDKDVPMRLSDDLAAMRWMQEHVRGSPVVAELNTYPTLYGWGDRYAMFTGNPDIVGWDYHQRQQRPGGTEEILQRINEVQDAYATADAAAAYETFRRYGVRYVVVGPLERAYYPAGQAKWEQRVGDLWDVAYQNAGVQILRLREVGGA